MIRRRAGVLRAFDRTIREIEDGTLKARLKRETEARGETWSEDAWRAALVCLGYPPDYPGSPVTAPVTDGTKPVVPDGPD